MTAIQQYRCPTVVGRELKPARRGLVGGFDLGDHAGERAVAQRILGHRQHLGVLATLSIENAVGAEADLLESGGVKIKPRQRPQHRGFRSGRKACCDAGREQCRRRVVAQVCRGAGDLMQPRAIEPAIRKPVVELRDPERLRRFPVFLRTRQLRAKRGKVIGVRPILEGRG